MRQFLQTLLGAALLGVSLPSPAVSVKPLGEQKPAQTEQLPAYTPPTASRSLMEHVKDLKPTDTQAPPPTMLGPPSIRPGELPPLPPMSLPPSGNWADMPPIPSTPHGSPRARTPAKKTSTAPAKPTFDLAACSREAQQQAGGAARMLRNDNRAYVIMFIGADGRRTTVSCYADRPKTVDVM